ncbi:MAG: hypothetical protein ABUS54_12185 [Actinomycetota bacterium]
MSPLERRAHTTLVEALLEELAGNRQELYLRKAFGARGPALRDLKGADAETRRRLAEVSGTAA